MDNDSPLPADDISLCWVFFLKKCADMAKSGTTGSIKTSQFLMTSVIVKAL